jgi:hypothetical protein
VPNLRTRNDPSGSSHAINIFLLDPRGYQPRKGGPGISKSTRLESLVDGVGRGTHPQRLDYTVVHKGREPHAGQRRHDVCTNNGYVLFALSHYGPGAEEP